MTPRSFLALCCTSLAAVAVAAAVVLSEDRPETVVGSGERVFPGLLDRVERLAAIRVRTHDATVTVRATANGWVVADRGDYPAAFEKVKATVLGFAALEKAEAKTAKAENYARLGVEDADTKGGAAREVSLLDDQGEALARLIIGKPAPAQGGEGGLFVRIPGEPRAWAVRGSVDPGAEPRDWVQRRLVDVAAEALVRISIRQPDGATLTLVRAEGAADGEPGGRWSLKELPAGARLKRADDLDGIAAVLAGLALDDLRPQAEIEFAKDKTTSARFEIKDGQTIGLDLVAVEGDRWIRLELPSGGQTSGATQTGADAQRVRGWAYRVPAWKLAPLQRRLAELVDSSSAAP